MFRNGGRMVAAADIEYFYRPGLESAPDMLKLNRTKMHVEGHIRILLGLQPRGKSQAQMNCTCGYSRRQCAAAMDRVGCRYD